MSRSSYFDSPESITVAGQLVIFQFKEVVLNVDKFSRVTRISIVGEKIAQPFDVTKVYDVFWRYFLTAAYSLFQ